MFSAGTFAYVRFNPGARLMNIFASLACSTLVGTARSWVLWLRSTP